MGGTSSDIGNSNAIDNSGNIYTIGSFAMTVDFDPGSGSYNLASAGYEDIFIQKLDANGNFIWAKSMGGTSHDIGNSIAIDNSGNIYTTGDFGGTVDFDPGSGVYNLTSVGYYDIFIQKLDANGDFIWAKSMGGTSYERGYSIALDNSGNVFTIGEYRETVDFDPGSGTYNLTSAGNDDVFIQKLDSSGNFIWAKSMGGSLIDYGNSIAIDNSGNIYTTGFFGGTADFDPSSGTYNLTSKGDWDIFVQKLDANGIFIWAKSMGGTSNENGRSIAVDNSGNVYTIGSFKGTVDFDPGSGSYNLTSAGYQDIFIQKLDTNGNFIWAESIGGTSSDFVSSIAIDNSVNIYIIGGFADTVDFDPNSGIYNLTSAGGSDIFILKLKQNTSGMSTIVANGLSVLLYPNPNIGSFILELNNASSNFQTYQLEVYTVMGKLIYQEEIVAGSKLYKEMNFETLSRGVYFLSLRSEDSILTTRFVVE